MAQGGGEMTKLEQLVVFYSMLVLAHRFVKHRWEIAEQLTAEDKGWA
jgi:hypothetical protein